MNYQKIHDSIIARAKSRKLNSYKERHHVVPRCLGGLDDADNIVELTAREHYVVHQLLVKLYPSHSGILYAAKMMAAGGETQERTGNRLYEWLKTRKLSHGVGRKNSQFGTCWVSNYTLKESRKIQKNELDYYKQQGWASGRVVRFDLTPAEEFAIMMIRNGTSIYKACKQNGLSTAKQNYERIRTLMAQDG